MEKHWENIINEIELKYQIKSNEDWAANKKEKLKKFQTSLELKIKTLIVENIVIAKEFLSKKVIHTYIELPEDRRLEILEKYIIDGYISNPKIDIRTLESNLSKKDIPYHKKMLNIFSMYVHGMLFEHFMAINNNNESSEECEDEVTIQQVNLSGKIQQFHETHFWVYYFHYEEVSKKHKIGKAILNIENKDKVLLRNVDAETATDFIGCFEIENSNQHLHIDLTAIQTKEKHLRITVYTGLGKVYPILVGVYTNIYGNNSMVAGSIILERVDDISLIQKMQPNSYCIEDAVKNGIDESIVHFLRKREQNFIKAPAGILTIPKLIEWRIIQNHKKDKP